MTNQADELKARLKKLNAQATQAKMDLHDLSEETADQLGADSRRRAALSRRACRIDGSAQGERRVTRGTRP